MLQPSNKMIANVQVPSALHQLLKAEGSIYWLLGRGYRNYAGQQDIISNNPPFILFISFETTVTWDPKGREDPDRSDPEQWKPWKADAADTSFPFSSSPTNCAGSCTELLHDILKPTYHLVQGLAMLEMIFTLLDTLFLSMLRSAFRTKVQVRDCSKKSGLSIHVINWSCWYYAPVWK